MEQHRFLLALALSLLLLVAYQELVLRRYQRPRPPAAPPAEQAAPLPVPPGVAGTPEELAAPTGTTESVAVGNELLRAAITPMGARVADLSLRRYRRTVAPDSEPLDLVAGGVILPVTIDLGEGVTDAALAYHARGPGLELHTGDRGEVTFDAERDGLLIEKTYVFSGDAYLFEVRVHLSGGKVPRSVGLVLTPIPPDRPGARSEAALALVDRGLVQKPLADLSKGPATLPPAAWAGFAAQYFLSVAAPIEGPAPVTMATADGVPIVRVEAPVVNGEARFAVFAGPKDREVLAQAGYELDRALDFGWFWFVAIPLLHALRVLRSVTGNYGVAIVVLTTMVKVATIPLTRTTFRNMQEMQKIQPQMGKLRERYKDDQATLQKEMMELYRRHRVNPLSGCLPMVLQLPIFVGLYNALSHAIELRHAPFALWINDLSAPDRLMIAGVGVPVLTLVMGATMFLQTWLSPQQGDPTQQRMMLFMPLVFTFMFINFPAGLVLYWLVNNVLTIGQQYAMMRSVP